MHLLDDPNLGETELEREDRLVAEAFISRKRGFSRKQTYPERFYTESTRLPPPLSKPRNNLQADIRDDR